jgi:hypothetical protein
LDYADGSLQSEVLAELFLYPHVFALSEDEFVGSYVLSCLNASDESLNFDEMHDLSLVKLRNSLHSRYIRLSLLHKPRQPSFDDHPREHSPGLSKLALSMLNLRLIRLCLTLGFHFLSGKVLDFKGSLLSALNLHSPVESLDSSSCIDDLKHLCLLGTLHTNVLIFQLLHILLLDREDIVLRRCPVT